MSKRASEKGREKYVCMCGHTRKEHAQGKCSKCDCQHFVDFQYFPFYITREDAVTVSE